MYIYRNALVCFSIFFIFFIFNYILFLFSKFMLISGKLIKSKPLQYKVLLSALGLISSVVPVAAIDPDSIVWGDTLDFSK